MREPTVIHAAFPGTCGCGCGEPFGRDDRIYYRAGYVPTIFRRKRDGITERGIDTGEWKRHPHPTQRVIRGEVA